MALTDNEVFEVLANATVTAEPVEGLACGHGARWVMDLDWYKRIRAVAEAFLPESERTDPDTWVPKPGDQIMGIRVSVREGAGQPHLQIPASNRGWWQCPNEPPCPHGGALHDIEDHEDTRPRCCVEGCACGQRSAAPC